MTAGSERLTKAAAEARVEQALATQLAPILEKYREAARRLDALDKARRS